MNLHFTKQAEDDLAKIYEYSFEQFGENQADKYYAGLDGRFNQILNQPELGRDFGFVKTGVKRVNFESHAIYFKTTHETLLILRVLHQRQDLARHL